MLSKKIMYYMKESVNIFCRHLAKDLSKPQIIERKEGNPPNDQYSVPKYTLYKRNLPSEFFYFWKFNTTGIIIFLTILGNVYVCTYVLVEECSLTLGQN